MPNNIFEEGDQPNLLVSQKPRRGRPPGRLNSPKGDAAILVDRVKEMYEVIEHMLTEDQREYYKRVFTGKEPFDALRHAEFFILLYGAYAGDITLRAMKEGIVSQDVAQTAREYRMGLKDIDDMKSRRMKEEDKNNEHGKLADPTRESSQSHLDKVIERVTKEAAGGSRRRTRV